MRHACVYRIYYIREANRGEMVMTKHIWLGMNMETELEAEGAPFPTKISLVIDSAGQVGMMPLYDTEENALRFHSKAMKLSKDTKDNEND